MTKEQNEFTIEYAFSPSVEAEDRLARAYDLILDLVIAELQNPEEDAAGVFPDVADAGGHIQSSRDEKPNRLGAKHVG